MPCIHLENPDGSCAGILTMPNPAVTLTYKGKTRRFEWHDYLGPMFCHKNGNEAKHPGERDPWWIGFQFWIEQGKQIKDLVCVWEYRTKNLWIVGRQIVPEGTPNARPMKMLDMPMHLVPAAGRSKNFKA